MIHHRLRRMVRHIENMEGESSRYARIEAEQALSKIINEYKKDKPDEHTSK